MGYLNKICKFIRRLCTIWKLNQHTTKGKNPLSTFPKDIVHYHYYDIHIFHHSNFTISNSGCIQFPTFPLYSTLCTTLLIRKRLKVIKLIFRKCPWFIKCLIMQVGHHLFTNLLHHVKIYSIWCLDVHHQMDGP